MKNKQELSEFFESIFVGLNTEPGHFIVFSDGENSETGTKLTPRILKVKPKLQSIPEILEFIEENTESHRNFYFGGSLMRENLKPQQRGGNKDVLKVFLIALDFDHKSDQFSDKWRERVPKFFDPSFVIETSPKSFQIFYLLDEPVEPEKTKHLHEALVKAANCDQSGKSPSSLWRIPFLPNWPNKIKVESGRDPNPFTSRLVNL